VMVRPEAVSLPRSKVEIYFHKSWPSDLAMHLSWYDGLLQDEMLDFRSALCATGLFVSSKQSRTAEVSVISRQRPHNDHCAKHNQNYLFHYPVSWIAELTLLLLLKRSLMQQSRRLQLGCIVPNRSH